MSAFCRHTRRLCLIYGFLCNMENLICSKRLKFYCKISNNTLQIDIPQALDADYGMYIWPSAPVLAQYIWYNRHKIAGKHILEIGAGTSLAGIVSAKVGGKVTLSDAAHLPKCLEICRKSCSFNNLQQVNVIGLTWGQFSPDLLELEKMDIILGSDCFYDSKDFEDILMTVAFLLERNKNAEFWTTYQERSAEHCIEHLMLKWGLVGKEVLLNQFDANHHNIAESELPGDHTIRMFVVTKKSSAT